MWAGQPISGMETTVNRRSGLFILQIKRQVIEQGDLRMLSTEDEEEMKKDTTGMATFLFFFFLL